MMSYLLIGDFKNLVAFLNIVTQRRRSRGQGRPVPPPPTHTFSKVGCEQIYVFATPYFSARKLIETAGI